MSPIPAFSKPSKAIAIDGEVVVDGPNGVGLSFTPDAARETGRRLFTAADEADAQVAAGTEDCEP